MLLSCLINTQTGTHITIIELLKKKEHISYKVNLLNFLTLQVTNSFILDFYEFKII